MHNVEALESYAAVLPAGVDAREIAYQFVADFPSESLEHSELARTLADRVDAWQRAWQTDGAAPVVEVAPLSDGQFVLLDTRGLEDTQRVSFVSRQQAAAILATARDGRSEETEWALERKLVLDIDSTIVPLATAEPEVVQEFEAEAG
jgi:hypothetical protein